MNDQSTTPRIGNKLLKWFFNGIVPLILLAVAALGAQHMLDTPSKAPRKPQQREARLVEFYIAKVSNHQINIEAMGTVKPARRVLLKPQVSGRLDKLDPNLVPGYHFGVDAPLMQIEKIDYKLVHTQRQLEQITASSNIKQAQAILINKQKELTIEQGNQKVAQREYDLLNEQISEENRDLVLRVPHLMAAKAAVESAKASIESAKASANAAKVKLDQAQLDLDRTTICTPFNSVVEQKLVDTGEVVSTGTPLVTLIGTDEYWLELLIPVKQLPWIILPDIGHDNGSKVKIYNDAWGSDIHRVGYVIRLLPSVEEKGRMARLLVAVPDPLSLQPQNNNAPILLIGTYVHTQITGQQIKDAIILPRQLLRDGRFVWVMNDKDQLEIRNVTVKYRGRDQILITKGLQDGERVIISNISAPVQNMPLRLNNNGRSEEVNNKPPTTKKNSDQ